MYMYLAYIVLQLMHAGFTVSRASRNVTLDCIVVMAIVMRYIGELFMCSYVASMCSNNHIRKTVGSYRSELLPEHENPLNYGST